MQVAQSLKPETQLEMLLDDIITKELPALHKKYEQQRHTNIKHQINHPNKTQTLTYKAPITKYLDKLTIQATNNNGENLYTIKRTNKPWQPTTQLQTTLSAKRLSSRDFFSQLWYLQEKEGQPVIQRTQELSNYLRKILRD